VLGRGVLAQPEVDAARIGLAGICLGGGYAIRAAAQDPRVRAVAGMAGGYNSPVAMAVSMGIGEYRAALSAALDRYDSYLPAVAPDGGRPRWRRRAVRLLRQAPVPLAALPERGHQGSLHSLMTFDARPSCWSAPRR
jgi:dienelactone hydrolase